MKPVYDFGGQAALAAGAARAWAWQPRAFGESGAMVVLADLDRDLAGREARRFVSEGGAAIGAADEAQVAE